MADINVACNSGNGVRLNTKDTICKNNIVVKPRAVSGLTLAANDNTADVTVGSTASSGKFNVTAPITAKMTAATPGWFSSGTATDSSVVVGKIAASSVGAVMASTTASAAAILRPSTQVTISKGYCATDRIVRAAAADTSHLFYVMNNAKYNITAPSSSADWWILKTNDAAARRRAEEMAEFLADTDDSSAAQYISLTNAYVTDSGGENMSYIGYWGYGESGGEIFFSSSTDPDGEQLTETILSWTSEMGEEVSFSWGDVSYISGVCFGASNLSAEEYQLIAALYGSAY